jgi:adenine phosphoribosyltransferase
MDYKKFIADVPDFPIEGIMFRDITPLMGNGAVFQAACDEMTAFAREIGVDIIAGPESRGFIFGCPVAHSLGVGFVPIRKPGKLPREIISVSYQLEYGRNTLAMHQDAIKPGMRVLIVDDLLATGGTIKASAELVEKLGGVVAGFAFLIELTNLKGRDLLPGKLIKTLIQY